MISLTEDDLQSLSVKMLKMMCRDRKQMVKGNKDDLIARLLESEKVSRDPLQDRDDEGLDWAGGKLGEAPQSPGAPPQSSRAPPVNTSQVARLDLERQKTIYERKMFDKG